MHGWFLQSMKLSVKTLLGFQLIICIYICFGQEGTLWWIPDLSNYLFSQVSSHIISIKRKYRSNYRVRQKSIQPLTTKQALSHKLQLRSQAAARSVVFNLRCTSEYCENLTCTSESCESFLKKYPCPRPSARDFHLIGLGKGGEFFKAPYTL